MKNFNWNEFKNHKIVVNCKTEKEAKDFIKQCYNHNIIKWTDEILLDYNDTNWKCNEEQMCYDCEDNKLGYANIDYFKINYKSLTLIEWSDYMEDTEVIAPKNKTQYNIMELIELPNGSKLYFERGNTKVYVYIDMDSCLIYEDNHEPFYPSKDNLKATFTLVSLPPKEVSFKEAVEHYSKGGNIKSILDGENKTYKGLTELNKNQKKSLTANGGFNLTVDEILNAKWYIIE